MKNLMTLIFIVATLFFFVSTSKNVTIQPGSDGIDTYIDETQPSVNVGQNPNFWIFNAPFSQRNGLIKFNLEHLKNKNIEAATLSLFTANTMPGASVFTLYRITNFNQWEELEATWANAISPSVAWYGSEGCSTPGVDYIENKLGEYNTNGESPKTEIMIFLDLNEFNALVQNNTGILLKTSAPNVLAFYSSEYANAYYRPKLTVTFSNP